MYIDVLGCHKKQLFRVLAVICLTAVNVKSGKGVRVGACTSTALRSGPTRSPRTGLARPTVASRVMHSPQALRGGARSIQSSTNEGAAFLLPVYFSVRQWLHQRAVPFALEFFFKA